MSQNTDNLALTKLTTGENFINSVLNANWDKLDQFAGTVNSKINTTNAQDMTNLNNVVNTGNYSYDKLSSAMTNAPSTGTYFSGTLVVKYCQTNKVMQAFVSSDGKIFTRHLWNGTWGSWQQMALNSQIVSKSGNGWVYSSAAVDFTVSKTSGVVIFRSPSSATTANIHIGFYSVHNNYVIFSWIGGTPSGITVTGGTGKFTVSVTTSYGTYVDFLEYT